MEHLKSVLGKRYSEYFKHNKPEDYINHGLGYMLKTKHDEMVKNKAILCNGKEDVINCDGWNVCTVCRGERLMVFEGSKEHCELEADKIRRDKKGLKVEVTSYPKTYMMYLGKERKLARALMEQDEYIENVVDDFGGELIPNF
jgi:hypothetical protein